MMDGEKAKMANGLFDKARSNLETPLTGEILTPLCLSCQCIIKPRGMELPRCKIYGDIPDEYIRAHSDDCKHYSLIRNCPEHDLPKIKKKHS